MEDNFVFGVVMGVVGMGGTMLVLGVIVLFIKILTLALPADTDKKEGGQ